VRKKVISWENKVKFDKAKKKLKLDTGDFRHSKDWDRIYL